jgi:hypothetical protein
VRILHGIVSVVAPIAVAPTVSYMSDADPIPLSVLCVSALTIWMKVISYATCNADYRCAFLRFPCCWRSASESFAPAGALWWHGAGCCGASG